MEKFILKKPVTYETKKHEAFDLSGLEDLSGEEYASLLKQAENIDGMDMVPEKEPDLCVSYSSKGDRPAV